MEIANQFKRPVLCRTEKDKAAYAETIFHLKESKWIKMTNEKKELIAHEVIKTLYKRFINCKFKIFLLWYY